MSKGGFFGLTVLGTNPFDSAILDYLRLDHFSDEEIRLSFERKLRPGSTTIGRQEVYGVLRDLYKGATPSIQSEVEMILNRCPGAAIDWETFRSAASAAREEVSKLPRGKSVTREYELSSRMQSDRTKHTRSKLELQSKQHVPLTATQELGWDADFIQRSEKDYFPLVTSDETRFAEAMIRQGEYF